MKTHTNDFKNEIKEYGRQLDSVITYEENGNAIKLSGEELNAIKPVYEGNLLKSVMKTLEIDSNVDISKDTIINYKLGVKVRDNTVLDYRDNYDYVDFGNYIVQTSEKQEDLISYKITCYDKMLYFMKPFQKIMEYIETEDTEFDENKTYYTSPGVEYTGATTGNPHTLELLEYVPVSFPITIRDYITKLCNFIGIDFANESDTFVNYNKQIKKELYLADDGSSLDYTYRDVLDELAQVTASTICINNNDELEIRYINDTQGKNLYRNSDTYEGNIDAGWTNGGTIDTENTKNGSYSIKTERAWAGPAVNLQQLYNEGKIQIGDTLTYSVYFKTNFVPSGTIPFSFTLYRGASSGGVTVKQYQYSEITPNEWYRLETTFEVTDYSITSQRARIELNYYDRNDAYYFGNNRENFVWFVQPQVEIGNTASDYSPNNLDLINEEYLKDINVNFGEKYGPINSVVFSRSAESDNIYRKDDASITLNGLCELKISDNQILNDDDREDFIDGVFDELKGLEYYINDYTSTGICYYELCDKYNISIDSNLYSCIMLNDEVNITQGLEELVHTELLEQSETDYTKADKTDRNIYKTSLIVDKQEGIIQGLVGRTETLENETEQFIGTTFTQTINDVKIEVKGYTDNKTQNLQDQIDNIDASETQTLKNNLVTIDLDGIHVSTDTSRIQTLIDNDEFSITDSGQEKLAWFGYDEEHNESVAQMSNLTITKYLIAGNHRVEKYGNSDERTGWFYIGGS